MPKRIEIYTSSHCLPCLTAMSFFRFHGIKHESKNIEHLDSEEVDVSSIPTIRCWDGTQLVHEYTGFGRITGNKIKEWYEND